MKSDIELITLNENENENENENSNTRYTKEERDKLLKLKSFDLVLPIEEIDSSELEKLEIKYSINILSNKVESFLSRFQDNNITIKIIPPPGATSVEIEELKYNLKNEIVDYIYNKTGVSIDPSSIKIINDTTVEDDFTAFILFLVILVLLVYICMSTNKSEGGRKEYFNYFNDSNFNKLI